MEEPLFVEVALGNSHRQLHIRKFRETKELSPHYSRRNAELVATKGLAYVALNSNQCMSFSVYLGTALKPPPCSRGAFADVSLERGLKRATMIPNSVLALKTDRQRPYAQIAHQKRTPVATEDLSCFLKSRLRVEQQYAVSAPRPWLVVPVPLTSPRYTRVTSVFIILLCLAASGDEFHLFPAEGIGALLELCKAGLFSSSCSHPRCEVGA
ncbi:hypothetical protein Hypma_003570 [Hypsizygus marmoreus]|uniref:Uncharacterized protein n=1 Tax=Hypsizygus marmoreus TaxID=39966 RepID=A0A369J6E0_HYPMA|nr:hypothetical protein Hypma_003570 [Hypsizygus marmoreus]